MGTKVHYISHPEVEVDPTRPVPRWRLSPRGIARMRAVAEEPALAPVRTIWASTETKAIEAAGLLAGALGLPVRVLPELGENDRSATGYLPPTEFERMADAFFARPDESVRGWESARSAQARIVSAVDAVLRDSPEGEVALVAHGGVGALLLAHLKGLPISRELDQPRQGCRYVFDRERRVLLSEGWEPLPEGRAT
ncbi:histidine phosphatase family protein [Cystobacter ferrugineus]|uniref:Histidine phosphatase family protein n=1 Tax=Cystobacter ferrugineus TaxID=83449 RepID=A0A1L9B0L1_9BACT|nr:histidine phosphatase family protein [Cystobacter ferrugineus]OJH35766.1 histidine phosphatase family protein [Cystobacter ferrugineus]